MTLGRYVTEAGSVVVVGGKHGGVYDIDFDWLEEGACCDAHPWVEPGEPAYLHWACDCCSCGYGCAELRREDEES